MGSTTFAAGQFNVTVTPDKCPGQPASGADPHSRQVLVLGPRNHPLWPLVAYLGSAGSSFADGMTPRVAYTQVYHKFVKDVRK